MLKNPTFVFFALLLTVSLTVGILSHAYFAARVFNIELNTYTFQSEVGNHITYVSPSADPVQVRSQGQLRTLTIEGKEYALTKKAGEQMDQPSFDVMYPDGRHFEVRDHGRILLSYDEQGLWVPESMLFVNDERIMSEGEERFTPVTLVTAAY
ncbi:hypothetical protein [Cohnella yongneupensis]|uniref:LPS export ABC transporter periplasmic protein LptC n=1 Tax=Cohnella yongneupensis TaxID=425006 RepID=A0ABW0R3M8_9BACL